MEESYVSTEKSANRYQGDRVDRGRYAHHCHLSPGRRGRSPRRTIFPLTGAVIGGTLTLGSILYPVRRRERVEPWLRNEQLAWVLIGSGVILWGFGESFWRYYISQGVQPFPSTADLGYSCFPLCIFVGLLLMPSPGSGSRRLFLLMDSLIGMGSLFAIAWFLLLGSLAQAPGEVNLAKFLGLYYPVADTALLSCVVFLLLRGQGRIYQA